MIGLGLNLVRHSLTKAAGVAALALGFSLFGASAPAQAQLFGWYGYQPFEVHENLPPGEIRRGLARQGYRVIAPFQRNGRVLLADVLDGRGRQLRLIVDPTEGAILQRFVNVEPRPPRGLRSTRDIPEAPEQVEPSAAPRAQRPAPKPKVAVRSLPQKPKVARQPQAPSEATLTPPAASPRAEPPAAAPREPAVAAAPVEAPRAAPAPVERPAAPAPRRPAEQPGFVNGVPNNPLD